MMPMKQIPILCVFALLFIECDLCLAEEPLIVYVNSFSPLTMREEGKYVGFDIDLWEAIAEDLGLKFRYQQAKSLEQIWTDLSHGKADVAIGGLTITAERENEKQIDFSHRYIEAGLRILVRKQMKSSVFTAMMY